MLPYGFIKKRGMVFSMFNFGKNRIIIVRTIERSLGQRLGISNLTSKTRFLEIGPSFGGILNKVINAGVAVCHGVEPNKKDAAFVLKNNKKAKIVNSAFGDAELPDEYYDMIVGIEVLEHTISPHIFLNKCFSILRENGLIHIEVPNHDDALLSTYKVLIKIQGIRTFIIIRHIFTTLPKLLFTCYVMSVVLMETLLTF